MEFFSRIFSRESRVQNEITIDELLLAPPPILPYSMPLGGKGFEITDRFESDLPIHGLLSTIPAQAGTSFLL
jgi:hypothetical protein